MPPQNSSKDSKKLGKLIRSARTAKGLSIRALADALGINFSSISYIESGRIHRPAVQTLRGLSGILEIPITKLYLLAGYSRPEGLPELTEYLHTKYGFSDKEAAEVEASFRKVLARRSKAVAS